MNPIYPYMDVVLLIYALAFFSLGLTIFLLNERDSALDVSRLFWLLAAFAFVHGAFEGIGLRRLVHGASPFLEACAPFVLLLSYLLLFDFGRRLVLVSLSETWKAHPAVGLMTVWLYLPMLLVILFTTLSAHQPLWGLTFWSRRLVGFPGACLAGLGFYLYWQNRIVDDDDLSGASGQRIAWYAAAISFVTYGVFGGLVDSGSSPPMLTSGGHAEPVIVFGLPIEILRASCAAAAAVSVGSLLTIFRVERKRKLEHVSIANRVAQQELYRIGARCDAILAATSEGILGIDTNGNVTFVNDGAAHMLGYPQQDLIGKPISVVAEQPAATETGEDSLCSAICRTVHDGVTRRETGVRFWRRNRTWFPAEYHVVPLQAAGKNEGAVIAFKDTAENALIEHMSSDSGELAA